MTQVYQFVDDNGVTRLFAEIVPDPAGTPFNGGTITAPLTVDVGALATAGGVEITGTSGANVKRLGVDFLHTTLDLTGDGVFDLRSDDNLGVNMEGDADSGASLTISNQPTGQFVDINVKNGARALIRGDNKGDGNSLLRLTGDAVFEVQYDGTPRINAHSAPVDATLGAGECALWFDQTNGAPALMVKAKQADGTVVTGSVPLA